MCPSAQQGASCGLNQWSLLTMALPDLCPGALQSVQPRSRDWRPWGTGGLALLFEPLSTVTSPANNCGSLQLSNSPSLSLRHTQDTPSELSLKWTVWNNDNHSRRKQEKPKNNKGSTDWNRTLHYLGFPIFFWETKSTFALSKSTESSWLYYGCEPG